MHAIEHENFETYEVQKYLQQNIISHFMDYEICSTNRSAVIYLYLQQQIAIGACNLLRGTTACA